MKVPYVEVTLAVANFAPIILGYLFIANQVSKMAHRGTVLLGRSEDQARRAEALVLFLAVFLVLLLMHLLLLGTMLALFFGLAGTR